MRFFKVFSQHNFTKSPLNCFCFLESFILLILLVPSTSSFFSPTFSYLAFVLLLFHSRYTSFSFSIVVKLLIMSCSIMDLPVHACLLFAWPYLRTTLVLHFSFWVELRDWWPILIANLIFTDLNMIVNIEFCLGE